MSRKVYDIDPKCQWCKRTMYRHPIIIWALYCLDCDRPPRR